MTAYPDVDEINAAVEPFQKLFNVVLRWQRAEKKWVGFLFIVKSHSFPKHTWLTTYYIRPFLYDIVSVSLLYNLRFIGYSKNCIGAIMQSDQVGTNTLRIATIT